MECLVEVPVESFVIETDMSHEDFISYLQGYFNFVNNSRVFKGSKGGQRSDEGIEPEIVMHKSPRGINQQYIVELVGTWLHSYIIMAVMVKI
jgi:hypothetical protein